MPKIFLYVFSLNGTEKSGNTILFYIHGLELLETLRVKNELMFISTYETNKIKSHHVF